MWTSLARDFAGREGEPRSAATTSSRVIARRKPGVTATRRRNADLSAVAASLGSSATPTRKTRTAAANAVDLHEAVVGDTKETVLILFGAVLLLFVVVCANVASLLLARGATRRAEMAARAALGATRGRLIAQLVTESVVMFLIAGAAGVGALGRPRQDLRGQDPRRRRRQFTSTSGRSRFALGGALLCGVLFGLVPALATSRVEPHAVLKETSAQAGVNKTQRAIRGGLVVAQVAVAFALLVASGIAVRGLQRTAAMPPGFDPDNLALADGDAASRSTTPIAAKQTAFYGRPLRPKQLGAVPGVDSAGFNSTIPMGVLELERLVQDRGAAAVGAERGPAPRAELHLAALLRDDADPDPPRTRVQRDGHGDSRLVLIISQETSRRSSSRTKIRSASGSISNDSPGDQDWREIIGIVGDVRKFGLVTVRPLAEAYVPLAQAEETLVALAVRSSRGDAIFNDLRHVVGDIDREVAPASLHSMTELIGYTLDQQRVLATLLGIFAIASLVLSTLGLFGLVSYTTSQRTRELGLRMALGSSPSSVIALVVRGGARLVGLGLGVGLGSARSSSPRTVADPRRRRDAGSTRSSSR